jgi:hypothetical protein
MSATNIKTSIQAQPSKNCTACFQTHTSASACSEFCQHNERPTQHGMFSPRANARSERLHRLTDSPEFARHCTAVVLAE